MNENISPFIYNYFQYIADAKTTSENTNTLKKTVGSNLLRPMSLQHLRGRCQRRRDRGRDSQKRLVAVGVEFQHKSKLTLTFNSSLGTYWSLINTSKAVNKQMWLRSKQYHRYFVSDSQQTAFSSVSITVKCACSQLKDMTSCCDAR